MEYDFGGYVTRNDVLCGDGRTIRKNAFAGNDGEIVPLVWNHKHDSVSNVLGHALLENRDDGVYGYCTLNETTGGKNAREMIRNGDISSMSIYANRLKHNGADVVHGQIREVSLVLAGANPGAYIDTILMHGEGDDEEGLIYFDSPIVLAHSEDYEYDDEEYEYDEDDGEYEYDEDDGEYDGEYEYDEDDEDDDEYEYDEELAMSDTEEATIADIFETLTDEQKDAVYAMIGLALEQEDEYSEEEEDDMKHNVFENDMYEDEFLSHSEIEAIFDDARRYGSLKDSCLAHDAGDIVYAPTGDNAATYGINGMNFLFPEDQLLNKPPEWIKRDTGWVGTVMSGVHHTPFSRIKSMFADITEDEARAKGYIKGALKKEEVFSLLKRSTSPTTIYKKQKLDRDDMIDITDFDVVAWLKGEMRMMLDEELARAFLFGDGRLASSDDKINEQNIRPAWTDHELFTIKARREVSASTTDDDRCRAFIRSVVKSRKDYKGSGNPVMFTTEDLLTDLLLMEDRNGRFIYESVEKLSNVLRVSRIITVPVMEGLKRTENSKEWKLDALILNLNDYNVGADKGGAVSMFDDFDIDYNAQKYLIETRCSGALIKPYSCIAIEHVDVTVDVQG